MKRNRKIPFSFSPQSFRVVLFHLELSWDYLLELNRHLVACRLTSFEAPCTASPSFCNAHIFPAKLVHGVRTKNCYDFPFCSTKLGLLYLDLLGSAECAFIHLGHLG
jgi:hypothetical protein